MKRSGEIEERLTWRVPMAVSTKKKNSGRTALPNKKAERHYERTVVQPAARLIKAITNKTVAAKTAVH